MDRRLPIAAIATLLLVAATVARAWDEGENFALLYEPPAAEWEPVRDPNRPDARVWKSRKIDREHFRIEVLRGAAGALSEIRRTLDGPGKASCASFDTTTLRESSVNGYPRLVWRTDCARADGARTTLLHLAVRGRDAIYLAMRIWPGEPSGADFDVWRERFERAFVCDTRSPVQGCPTP